MLKFSIEQIPDYSGISIFEKMEDGTYKFKTMASIEFEILTLAMKCSNNKKMIAKDLGIGRSTLYRRYKKLCLNTPSPTG